MLCIYNPYSSYGYRFGMSSVEFLLVYTSWYGNDFNRWRRKSNRLDNPFERDLEKPDVIVGPLNLFVCGVDLLYQYIKSGFLLERDHENGVRAREAARVEMGIGTVALAFYMLPPRVVIDAGVVEKLHHPRRNDIVANQECNFHEIAPLKRFNRRERKVDIGKVNRRERKRGKNISFIQLIYQSSYTIFESLYIEVDEQTELTASQLQVSQHLSNVDVCESLHGFNFDYYFAFDQKIQSISHITGGIFIDQRKPKLSLKFNSSQLEFTRKGSFVCRFQETRAKCLMDLEGGSDDLSRQLVLRLTCI